MSDMADSAPDFILEVANGPSLRLSELWQQHTLLLWFSRGLACPFCRRQIVQVAQLHEPLREHDTLVVQITPTEREAARTMLEFFPVEWPYGCDPEGKIAAAYNLVDQGGIISQFVGDVKQQTRAWGLLLQHPAEPHPDILPAVEAAGHPPAREGGMVVVDQRGQIRFRQPSGKLSLLPTNAQLLETIRGVTSAPSK